MIRRFMVIVGALVIGTVACSSGSAKPQSTPTSSGTLPRTAWDSAATATVRGLAAKVTAAVPGQCADIAVLPVAELVANLVQRKLLPIPLAVADCTAFATTQEFAALRNNTERDGYVESHRNVICAQAKRTHVRLPGLHWAIGDRWVVQSGSEGASRRMAEILGVTYLASPCPGAGQIDWDTGAIARSRDLAKQLSDAGLGCADWTLADREVISSQPELASVGVPAAVANCTAAGSPTVIEIFGSGGTGTRDAFAAVDAKKKICGSPQGSIVSGPDWAMLVASQSGAKQIARQLQGTVSTPSCG